MCFYDFFDYFVLVSVAFVFYFFFFISGFKLKIELTQTLKQLVKCPATNRKIDTKTFFHVSKHRKIYSKQLC